jgi:hypothetical protein
MYWVSGCASMVRCGVGVGGGGVGVGGGGLVAKGVRPVVAAQRRADLAPPVSPGAGAKY